MIPVLAFVVLAAIPDSGPPDLSHMLPEWDEALADNPLSRFERVCDTLGPIPQTTIDDLLAAENFDTDSAGALLANHARHLQAIRTLSEQTRVPWQWQGMERVADLETPPTDWNSLRFLPTLRTLETRHALESGDLEKAINLANSSIDMGWSMASAKGSLVHFLFSQTMVRRGLRDLRWIALHPKTDPRRLVDWFNFRDEYSDSASALRFALKVEHVAMTGTLRKARSGNLEGLEEEFSHAIFAPLLHPNESSVMLADYLYRYITLLEGRHEWSELKTTSETLESEIMSLRSHPYRMYFHPNSIGRILVTMATPAYSKIVRFPHEIEVEYALTNTTAALRRFQNDQKTLPTTLSELVPEYLPEVPIDAFTDRPLLWNAETRVLYAVGSDGNDNGGQLKKRGVPADERDLGVQIP